VFVLPAVVGVVFGGFVPGVVGAVAGFLVYDYFFVPPYDTLTLHSPQNSIALVVYGAVVLVVAQVVTKLRTAREEALQRTGEAQRLYELSQELIGELTLSQLLAHVVDTVQDAFAPRWTALVLPEEGDRGVLEVAAVAGQALDEAERTSLTTAAGGRTTSLGLRGGDAPARISLALVVGNRPVGLLVLQDVTLVGGDRRLLGAFVNQAALAIDRARLREEALRARLLEEVDRWRSALMGAASHDLRTPLAGIKAAVSSLRQAATRLTPADRAELLELIELQTDRLARLVSNLLDMTRIQSGALEIRPAPVAFDDLVAEALHSVSGILPSERVAALAPPDLPLLRIDRVLVGQVLANLLENAERLSPAGSPITVTAEVLRGSASTMAEIAVADDGPGIAREDRERVFEMFSQMSGGGRAGLGLAIAKAFVEAHGGLIWIDPEVTRGARVVFTVPCEALVPAPA